MTATVTTPDRAGTPTEAAPPIDHIGFWGSDVALCGVRLAGDVEVPYDPASATHDMCVVCEDLAGKYIDGTWHPAKDGAA